MFRIFFGLFACSIAVDISTFIERVESLGSPDDLVSAVKSLLPAIRLAVDNPPTCTDLQKEHALALKAELKLRWNNVTFAHPQLTSSVINRPWFSLTLRAGGMHEAEELKWNYGDSLYLVAKQFCSKHSLDLDIMVRPIYDAMSNLEAEKMKLPLRLAPVPPWDIPDDLRDRFTMNGKLKISRHYRDDAGSVGPERRLYSRLEINRYIAAALLKKPGYYGATDRHLFSVIQKRNLLAGKKVAIMGSLQPWYESICVGFGGEVCATAEYHPLKYMHPRMITKTLAEFEGMKRDEKKFEIGLSISSFEHDGLGRYGDPVDPDGDILAMENMRRLLVPSGILLLAVPCGKDELVWNAHRVYGRHRLRLLLQNWTVEEILGMTPGLLDTYSAVHVQPLFVLRNELPASLHELQK